MRLLFTAIAALVASFSVAIAEDGKMSTAATVALAKEYLAAYSTYDMAKIEPYLSDDAVFNDPTSSNQNADGAPFVFHGKEAILKGLSDYAAQYSAFDLSYEIERVYESNGNVVFVAQLSYVAVTSDDQTYTGTAPIVTVVRVADGKIAGQTDYYDYNGNAADTD